MLAMAFGSVTAIFASADEGRNPDSSGAVQRVWVEQTVFVLDNGAEVLANILRFNVLHPLRFGDKWPR